MSHTPGPWTVAAGPTYCAIRTDARVIADMRLVGLHHNKADATLIAASPALLDLCRRALRALDEDSYPQLRDDLREAIDKAEAE